MRLALLSDIHGNRIALDAVVEDARRASVDAFCVVGDLVAIGPEPVAVLDALAALDPVTMVRGNTDRYVVTGDGPPPTLEQVHADPTLAGLYARIRESFAWTRGFVTAAGWFDRLAALPLDATIALADGTRLLAVHASPGTDDGEGVHPGRSNAELAAMVDGCGVAVVCVGHTHEPVLRQVGGTTVVNLGAVSNPVGPDPRASYVLLESHAAGTSLQHRRVPYDYAAFIEQVHRSRHPSVEFILSYQRLQHRGRTPHADHVVPPQITSTA
jgi:predicted phosphodiesterase